MTIKKVAIISLILGLTILAIYLLLLMINGYLRFDGTFSLEITSKIAPFIGSGVGIFFTLSGTLLIFENLQMTRKHNENNQLLSQKNQFENIFFNLLTQQRQIKDSIKVKIIFEEDDDMDKNSIGFNFFDDLATKLTLDFRKKDNTIEELIKLYNHWFTIHNSSLGHFFRHMYHIVKFVHKNPYFQTIENNPKFLQKKEYLKILRAQLSNSEIVLLALNCLTRQGEKFKVYVDLYELLININLEQELPDDYISMVPGPKLIVDAYPQLEGYL